MTDAELHHDSYDDTTSLHIETTIDPIRWCNNYWFNDSSSYDTHTYSTYSTIYASNFVTVIWYMQWAVRTRGAWDDSRGI